MAITTDQLPRTERAFRLRPAKRAAPVAPSRHDGASRSKARRGTSRPKGLARLLTHRRYLKAEYALVLLLTLTSLGLMAGFGALLFLGDHPVQGSEIFDFVMIAGLFACGLAYQVNRFGASRRQVRHRSLPPEVKAALLSGRAPPVTILIPSYREEPRVLAMTLLSAALAQYSNRRITVLIDDPPDDHDAVTRSLAAVEDVRLQLEHAMTPLVAAAAGWRLRLMTRRYDLLDETQRLATLYRNAAFWLDRLAARMEREVTEAFRHVDTFFIDAIPRNLADTYRRHADQLAFASLDAESVTEEYRRLQTLFCTDIESFQRKTFLNLSHAPNKAMNLNAFIGLIGGRYRYVESRRGWSLAETAEEEHDLAVPDADYVLTLDADSVVLPNYLLDLVHILEARPHVGVAQSPYLTFPNSKSPVERIAGATTDIQYLAHQGSSYFGASYWVGANALIRLSALREVRRERIENGLPVEVFIQDDTVIEDTGSTIDLLEAGWTVHNHFAPLAYSATPADFGALAIQRKRWSNGGLIIAPALLRQYLGAKRRLRRLPELGLRANYLLSPLVGNGCIFLLMLRSESRDGVLLWTPLVILPYFLLYALDLVRLGYKARDVFGVCSLNLMLLPVSFAGIGASIVQMVTGRHTAFSRTPKVANRTFIPPVYFLFNIAMTLLMLRYVWNGIETRRYGETVIPLLNIALYGYGLVVFVGLRQGFSDLTLSLRIRGEAVARAVTRPLLSLRGRMGRRATA